MNALPARLRSVVLLMAASCGPLLAADARRDASPPPYDPPVLTFPDNRISLIDAVRLTLRHDPNIKLSEQQTRLQEGVAQTETGRFDLTLLGNLNFSLTQTALTRSQVIAEEKRRTDIQKTISDITQTRDTATNAIGEYQRLAADPTGFRLTDTGEQTQFDVLNTTIRNTADPEVRALYENLRTDLIARGLATNQQIFSRSLTELAIQQQRLADLGPLPKENQSISGTIGLQLVQPARNGITPGVIFNGSFESDRFKGKRNNADFGGKGSEDVYSYSVGFTVDALLLRGRGIDATGAPERAALIDYDASELTFKHSASVSVLNTIAAYWSLVAAQEQLDIARKSVELQNRRVEVTNALISGDEIPRSERARVLASQAGDQSLVFNAARAVNEARVNLARAMGLSVLEEANAPLASDPFPGPADPAVLRRASPDELITSAVDRRYDRLAARKLIESGGVLLRAAETDLRPRLDLHSQITAGTVAERRIGNTGHGWSAPSFSVALDFEKPFGNHAAKGRLEQRDATLKQRSITATDLDRNIKANVVQFLRSLQETADQVQRAREAVDYYGRTIESENEMFRSGQSSLIDTILTQQLQTGALITYALARQQYATLLAQLRFESGTLVREGPRDARIEPNDLVTLPFAGGIAK
ncbi:MAG: TolC family protein [Acidobacteriota bacterium]|nr:TolC family protein [Acidobacteriota bacterium]